MKKIMIVLSAVIILAAAYISNAQGLKGLEVAFSAGGLLGDTSRDTLISGTRFKDEVEDDALFMGRVGYLLYKDTVGIEANIGGAANNFRRGVGGSNTDFDAGIFMFDIGPFFQFDARVISTFINFGMGAFNFDTDNAGSTTEFTIVFGGGVKYYMTDNIGFRFDMRDHIVFLNDETFWGTGAEDNIHLLELSGGIFYQF